MVKNEDLANALGLRLRKPKSYDFPNAIIKIDARGICRHFPKWCQMISVERPRVDVACALRELRKYKHAQTVKLAMQ